MRGTASDFLFKRGSMVVDLFFAIVLRGIDVPVC